jgi:hypothetical protein
VRTCSSCGGQEDLHLVTLPFEQKVGAVGRTLLYCWKCRTPGQALGVSIPIDLVNEAVFCWLYFTGRTASEPSIATEIVFGEERPELARRLAEFIYRDDDRADD